MSLLRKTRKWLLEKNKFGKYAIYAIGEVFLIVIGILIALGLNNWKERKSGEDREQFYLSGLREEFQQSKRKLENLTQVNRVNYEDAKKIASMMNNPEAKTSEKELSQLLYNSVSYELNYNPNNSLLNELISSGGLKDISNPVLRAKLTGWESFVQSVHRQEANLREQREKLLDIFRNSNERSIRTILDKTQISEQLELRQAEDPVSNLDLLTSTEFENNLLIYILTGTSTETAHYQPLLKEIDEILLLINAEIAEID
ncbi:hypothetical protein E0K83_03560 [Gramella sp. BOM4]|nr:hypothetical protein [Christiangramia bathymodioli]